MITENLSTLKIHKLTQAQYDRELAAGNIDENALYLTPDEEIDLTPYATVEELNGKADAEHTHNYAGSSSIGGSANSAVKLETARKINGIEFDGTQDIDVVSRGGIVADAPSSADFGSKYIATVSGITELTDGVSFIMIPRFDSSTTSPTLNVNDLGYVNIIKSEGLNNEINPESVSWLKAGCPVHVVYDGENWVAVGIPRVLGEEIVGAVPITKGGTGSTTAEGALTNLGAAPVVHEHSTDDITSGTLPIARGGTGADTVSGVRTALGVTQELAFSQIDDTTGGKTSSGIDAYPTRAGVFRVTTGSASIGIPGNYGCLLIFNGGGYYMHLYVNADGMWFGRTTSMTAPTWNQVATK